MLKQISITELTNLMKSNCKLLVLVLVALVGIPVAAQFGMKYHALVVAENHLAKGYNLLAEETLEPYRNSLSSSERGCKALINTYYQTRDGNKLEWAAQSCLSHGKELAEVQLGRAAGREFTGKDNEAIQILVQAAPKYDKMPDIPFRLAQILQRNKRDKEAVRAYLMAAERAPQDNKLALDVLQYAVSIESWGEAKVLANRLKSSPTESPEVKLIIAKALARGGDTTSAKAVVAQARDLLAKNPDLKNDLESRYAELFNPNAHPVTTAGTTSRSQRNLSSQ